MDEIKNAAIIGAGALGAYFIWGLSQKLGKNLYVIADGKRKQRLENDGLIINDKQYKLNVCTAEQAGKVDLLLIATKFQSLEDVLDDIEEVTGENTTVMSLMNGVTSEEIIAQRIGEKHMLYCTMRIASERNGNSVKFDEQWTPGLFYGEKNSAEKTQRIYALEKLLSGTGIHYHHCENIMQELWEKFALNISQNLPQAILSVGVGAYIDSEYVRSMSNALREETAAVAAKCKVDISKPSYTTRKKGIAEKWARYSTLQDLDAGRKTEIDMFSGTLIKLGEKYGVPTPYNRFVYWTIKALEEKNDGKFEYKKQ